MGLFTRKKKNISEDSIRVEPAEKIIDVVKLCERCPFVGQCGFADGCASYQQIVKDREEYLAKIRGYSPETNPAPPSNWARMPRYIIGISWREHGECGKNHWIIYRIVDCSSSTVKIKIVDKVLLGDNGKEITIDLPIVETKNGDHVVDFKVIRNSARKAYTTSR